MRISIATVFALVIAACGQPGDPATGQGAEPAETPPANRYADALAVSTRLEADFGRDLARKPDEVLAFFGIEPGMDVLDLFSGGGYYSEILSHVVGEDGSVVAHANQAYLNFVGDEFGARHADGRLPNVRVLMAENNELVLEPDSFDAVILVLSYHDLYYVDPERGWPQFDVPKLLAELKKGLRPGGIVGIVDHQAAPGSPPESGNSVHRIDADVVIEQMSALGFELEARSDLLRNPDDDYAKNVFDPQVRGKTDRFILRFRNPG